MVNLLYVCQYNIIRSPIAAQITQNRTNDKNLYVSSGGLDQPLRSRMPPSMKEVLRRRGYSYNGHTPRRVTDDDLRQQNLILCFAKADVGKILNRVPELEGTTLNNFKYAFRICRISG